MKTQILLLVVIMFFVSIPAIQAQEFGKIRLLQQRAAYVTKQKNDFVAQVLATYNIPHERNAEGVVVRINTDGQWQDVTTIEIVPLLKESTDKRQYVAAHELYFHTAIGILDLMSELTVR
jgi:hypothetical protein